MSEDQVLGKLRSISNPRKTLDSANLFKTLNILFKKKPQDNTDTDHTKILKYQYFSTFLK